MSTTILYLAIVAICAGFLVPAWIRRPHRAEVETDVSEVDADGGDFPADGEDAAGEDVREVADVAAATGESAYTESYTDVGDADPDAWADSVPALPQSRQQMLRARRRALATLVAVTVGAAACVAGGLLPWWTAVLPAAMLTFYVLLLREVAKAEAEAAQRRAHQAAEWAREAAVEGHGETAGRPATWSEPIAEVIDISNRVSDQLYDQYADAAVRAVGD